MPAQFDLTARLNLVGPVNVKPIVSSLQSQLKNIKANINVSFSKAVSTNLNSATTALKNFNTNLNAVIKTSKTAQQAFHQLASSVSNIKQATNGLVQSTKPLKQAGQEIKNVTNTIEDFGAKSALALKRNAAFLVPTTIIFGFITATKKGISEALNFEREMVRLSQVTGRSLSSLQGLQKEVTNLSKTLGVSSKELIDVSVTLAQAGLKAKDVEVILKSLAQSSLAPTFDSMKQTTEGVIAAFSQFQLKAEDVEGVLGSLNSVAAAYAVESDDLITVIRRTGGAFKAAGGNLNELISLFTSVRQTTRESAETIATGFRTIFTRIQRPKTIEFLREFNIELTDLQGKFVGPYEAIRRLSEGLQKLDSRDLRFAGIIEELGGFRQVSKVIPLIQQFTIAQEALGVAEHGAGSLARDAATAQQSLLVQITKVKEEFNDLFRTIAQDQGFRALVQTTLSLASAFATVAKAITPVLPLLTVFGAVKGFSALKSFNKGFFGKGFAGGGLVPGTGNSDSVPARLTPGEFVLRKSAVQAMGAHNASKLNKYASGGKVDLTVGGNGEFGGVFAQQGSSTSSVQVLNPFGKNKKEGLSSRTIDAISQSLGIPPNKIGRIAGRPSFHYFKPGLGQQFKDTSEKVLLAGINKQVADFYPAALGNVTGISQGDVRKQLIQNLGIEGFAGNLFEGFIHALAGPSSIGKRNPEDFDFKVDNNLREALVPLFGDVPSSLKYIDSKFTGTSGPGGSYVDILRKAVNVAALQGGLSLSPVNPADKEIVSRIAKQVNASKAQPKKATGGSVDSVHALLTPGEFVINKQSASKIGLGNLNKLNNIHKFQHGGKVPDDYNDIEDVIREHNYPTSAIYGKNFADTSSVAAPVHTLAPDAKLSAEERAYARGAPLAGPGSTTTRLNSNDLDDSGIKSLFKQVKKMGVDSQAVDKSWEELKKANLAYTVSINKLTGKQEVRLSYAAKAIIAEQNQARIAKVDSKANYRTVNSTYTQEAAKIQNAAIAASGGGIGAKIRGGFGKVSSGIQSLKASPLTVLAAGAGLSAASQFLPEKYRSGAQGAITGATAGASVGAIFGPWGIAIGGAVGALKGFTDAAAEAANQLEDKKLDVTLKDLDEKLQGLGTQVGITNENRQNLNDRSQAIINTNATKLSNNRGGFINKFIDVFSGAPTQEGFNRRQIARGVGITSELSASNNETINLLKAGIGADLRGGATGASILKSKTFGNLQVAQGISELKKRSDQGDTGAEATLQKALAGDKGAFKELVEAGTPLAKKFVDMSVSLYRVQHQFDGLIKTLNTDISSLQTLSQSFDLASENLDRLDNVFSSTKDILSGSITGQKFNENTTKVTFGADNQGGRISAIGNVIGGSLGRGFTNRANDIQSIAKELPAFLEAHSGDAINEINNEVLSKFNDAFGSNEVAGAIGAALAKDTREILDLAKVDPQRAAELVLGPTKDAFQKISDDINKSLVSSANKLSTSFTELSQIVDHTGELQDKRNASVLALVTHNAEIGGNVPALSTLLGPSAARQGRLQGGVANGDIAATILQKRGQLAALQSKNESNPLFAVSGGLNQASGIQQEISNLIKALDDLANPTERLAAINTKLAEAEARRQSLANAAGSFIGGTAVDRLKQVRNLSQAQAFARLSPQQQAALSGSFDNNRLQNIQEGLQHLGPKGEEARLRLLNNSGAGQLLNPFFGNAEQDVNNLRAFKGNILQDAVNAGDQKLQIGQDAEAQARQQILQQQQDYLSALASASSKANESALAMATKVQSITDSLAKIPSQIEVGGTIEHNININGAEAFKQIEPYIVATIQKQLNQSIDPERGAKPVTNSAFKGMSGKA